MPDFDLIDTLRNVDAVQYGEFELSHAGTSEYYIDKYLYETDPECLSRIAQSFAARLDTTKLAGVELGAVPLVVATSLETKLPSVIVRKKQKEYGSNNRIEGNLAEGEQVVVIEDVAMTGQSALNAVAALREAGAVVNRVLVIVDREEGVRERLAEHDIELDALLTTEDLLADV